MLLFLFISKILCLKNNKSGKVILTDFYNEYSPVYVITPYYEQYYIDLFDSKDILQNTSFSDIQSSTNNLSISIDPFIQYTQQQLEYFQQYTFSDKFCPIDEWTPLFQPARFYLSTTTLDLLFYNETTDNIVQIQSSLHTDLTLLHQSITSIKCFSIITLRKQDQFGLDCNVNNETTIMIFDLIYNDQNGIITNFTFNTSHKYEYKDAEQQNFIKSCEFRKTLNVKIFNDLNDVDNQFCQYCPLEQTDLYNNFFIIFDYHLNLDRTTYEFKTFQGNLSYLDSCQIQEGMLIEQMFSNIMTDSYNNNTWNLGFILKNTSSICKCNVKGSQLHDYKFNCSTTVVGLYDPNQLRTVQTVNEDLILITATNLALLIIQLEKNSYSEHFYDISYKEVYEPGYNVVDFSITNEYLAVILSNSTILNQTYLQRKLSNQCENFEVQNGTNILKIFYLAPTYQAAYYQNNNIAQQQIFLQSLNQIELGDFFLIYDFVKNQLSVITLFNKQLALSYNLSSTKILERINEPLNPSIVSFNITGGYSSYDKTGRVFSYQTISFKRMIIICYIKLEDNTFQLIAEAYFINSTQTLNTCPVSQDLYVFQEIVNSIDLFQGIMGPLLNFNYIPNYNFSRFYPFYQNHKSVITKNEYSYQENIQIDHSIYNVLSAINKNVLITSNVFGLVEILLTYNNKSKILLNDRAVIMNQTCIINARQYESMQKQFPIQLEIQQCSENVYRNLSTFLDQVDYFFQSEYYDISVQYIDSIVVLCQKQNKITTNKNCEIIKFEELYQDTINQIYIQKGPIKNERIVYYFTILYASNLFQLKFFYLELLLPNSILPNITEKEPKNYNNLNVDVNIVSFRYTNVNQQALFVLYQNATIKVYTPGPSNTTFQEKLYNFTSIITNINVEIIQCVNSELIGFDISNYLETKMAKQYLVVWCQNNYSSYIFQYIISNVNQIKYWRRLPIFEATITSGFQVLISGLILYVPIKKNTDYHSFYQYYYIYNLADYTPRSLVEEIEIEKTRNETIITFPINNLANSLVSGSSISLTLIITKKKFVIYYLNQKADFIFHLQQQFIEENKNSEISLMIAVYQPNKVYTLYRNYTLIFNFKSTQIEFSKENNIYIQSIDGWQSKQGGFYEYLLLVNQSFFSGPISSYNYSTQNQDLTIVPSPYLQMNKYLGNYMETINLFGQATQIIDLGDEIYVGLYQQQLIDKNINVLSYQDLILVLTDSYLLFYQKVSFAQQNHQCKYTDYNQSKTESLCSIRQIYALKLELLQNKDNYLYCQMQLNGIDQLIILCQLKYSIQMSGLLEKVIETKQDFTYIQFQYLQAQNFITVNQTITNTTYTCFCFFYEIQPFLFQNNVYQIIKTSYYEVNSYFGIYYVNITNNILEVNLINSYPNQYTSQPYEFAPDYSISLISYNNSNYLYLIILQSQNIYVQVINLDENFSMTNQASNLLFNEKESYVRFNGAVFIQSLNHFQPNTINEQHPYQSIMIGNNNQIYEIIFNVFTFEAQLTYTFQQYLLCHHNFISRPQISLSYQNDSIYYLVTQCLSNQFEYESIQVEMTYLLNQLNANIVYTSFFIRNFDQNYSRPVEILEPYLVNPEELHFQKIQLYQVTDLSDNTSKTHLLITNNTYFLIDLLVYASNGYVLYYPIDSVTDSFDQNVSLNITAINSYSSCTAQFTLEWHITDHEINTRTWFWVIFSLIFIMSLLIAFVALRSCCKKQSEDEIENQELADKDDESEHGYELQRQEKIPSYEYFQYQNYSNSNNGNRQF